MENELIRTKQKLELSVASFDVLLQEVAAQLKLPEDAQIEIFKSGSVSAVQSFEDLGEKAKVEIRAVQPESESEPEPATQAVRHRMTTDAALADIDGLIEGVTDSLAQQEAADVACGQLSADGMVQTEAGCAGPGPEPEPEPEPEAEVDPEFPLFAEQTLQEQWQELDQHRIGTLIQEDVAIIMERLGLSISDAELEDAMTGFDGFSGQGNIDYVEFLTWMREKAGVRSTARAVLPFLPPTAVAPSLASHDRSQQPRTIRDTQASSTRLIEQLRQDRQRRAEESAKFFGEDTQSSLLQAQAQAQEPHKRATQLLRASYVLAPPPGADTRSLLSEGSFAHLEPSVEQRAEQLLRASQTLSPLLQHDYDADRGDASSSLKLESERSSHNGGDGSSASTRSPVVDEVLSLVDQLSLAEREEVQRRLGGTPASSTNRDGSPSAALAHSQIQSEGGMPAALEEGVPPTTPEQHSSRARLAHSAEILEEAWLEIDSSRCGTLDCGQVDQVLQILGAHADHAVLEEELATGFDSLGEIMIEFDVFMSWYPEGILSGKIRKRRPPAVLKRLTSSYVKHSSPGVSKWADVEATQRELQAASSSSTKLIEQLRRDRERRAARRR